MPTAPLSPSEPERLAAVQALRLVGTPAEDRFDRITRLAKRLYSVPYAMIDLVCERDVYFKSAQGLDGMTAPRHLSYCQYAILNNEACLVPDARLDPRFSDLSTCSEFVFYAGLPLRHRNENVGTLCIADRVPRQISAEGLGPLWDLAQLAEQELTVSALSEEQLRLASEVSELSTQARVDALTKAWNRGAIEQLAIRELEAGRIRHTATGILLLDVDHFKKINDTQGHDGGDQVLRQVACRIREAVRPTDAVGRWGGEEFLVVLPTCTLVEASAVAERIRSNIARSTISHHTTELHVTVSIGGTTSTDGGHFLDVLTKTADRAMYAAKAAGRNQSILLPTSPSIREMFAIRQR